MRLVVIKRIAASSASDTVQSSDRVAEPDFTGEILG